MALVSHHQPAFSLSYESNNESEEEMTNRTPFPEAQRYTITSAYSLDQDFGDRTIESEFRSSRLEGDEEALQFAGTDPSSQKLHDTVDFTPPVVDDLDNAMDDEFMTDPHDGHRAVESETFSPRIGNGEEAPLLAGTDHSSHDLSTAENDPSPTACNPFDIAMCDPSMTVSYDDDHNSFQSSTRSDYGGLHNLGNTCYMASAIQMLASLDGFANLLPGQADKQDTRTVRRELLGLMNRLEKGETVHPDEFKSAIDDRTSLFLGYRQQDSHEFLTTLLDLLDEDTKASKSTQQEEKVQEERKLCKSLSGGCIEMDPLEKEEDSSPVSTGKRLRTGEPKVEVQMLDSSTIDEAPVGCAKLSQLGVEEIGRLLHETYDADPNQLAAPLSPGSISSEPRYKLIGGRMNTADIPLTRYSRDDHLEQGQVTVSTDGISDLREPNEESPPTAGSPLAKYFTTEVRVRLTCDSCKYSRSHKEKYWHLSLEIGAESGSVDEGLRRFFAPEKREIKCEKCFCCTATQTSQITRLPSAMLLHFKRFIVDVSPDYTSVSYRKNRSPVTFAPAVPVDDNFGPFSEFLATDCIKPSETNSSYSIRSVVNHIGSSASCGHYTADSLRLYDEAERKWTRFNDEYVSTITQDQALEQSRDTAYMVMYEWPSP